MINDQFIAREEILLKYFQFCLTFKFLNAVLKKISSLLELLGFLTLPQSCLGRGDSFVFERGEVLARGELPFRWSTLSFFFFFSELLREERAGIDSR